MICSICQCIPQGEDIVECNKCDKIFCMECLDQFQYTEIKKKKQMGHLRDEYNPGNDAVQKMECPKYHIFYGYTPQNSRELSHAYGLSEGPQAPKPRKSLNNFVRSFVLEQLEFTHTCSKAGAMAAAAENGRSNVGATEAERGTSEA